MLSQERIFFNEICICMINLYAIFHTFRYSIHQLFLSDGEVKQKVGIAWPQYSYFTFSKNMTSK